MLTFSGDNPARWGNIGHVYMELNKIQVTTLINVVIINASKIVPCGIIDDFRGINYYIIFYSVVTLILYQRQGLHSINLKM